jgi:PAS domain S-box-containing protein
MAHAESPGAPAPLSFEWGAWIEQHPLPHLIYDPATLEQLAGNAAARERYGCNASEFTALRRSDLLAPAELPRLHDFIAGLPGTQDAAEQPLWHEISRDGRSLYAEYRGMAVVFQGRLARLAVVIDADPRVRLAAAAERSSGLRAVAGRVARVGGWAMDCASGRIAFGEEVRTLHEIEGADSADKGVGAGIGMGMGLEEALAFYPDAAAGTLRTAFELCAEAGVPFDLELPFVGARGTRRYVRTLGRAVRDATGRIVRVEGAQQDVTAAVELGRRFHRMADAAPVAIFMADARGLCNYTNPAWEQLWRTSLRESLGEGWLERVHPDDRALLARLWRDTSRGGADFETEVRLLHTDGSSASVWVRANALQVFDGGGGGHVGTVVDLTQARELEAARRAQAVAQETGRRQAAFMSRVSHELRTPLNAILGFGQLLQGEPVVAASHAASWAGHVVTAGRQMLALVDDLLELQRLEQGQLDVRIAPVDVAALLRRVADALDSDAQEAGIAIETRVEPGLELASDERCLLQLLLNLASNGIKYGRPVGSDDASAKGTGFGRPALRIEARRDGSGVLIEVIDSGPGIEPAALARLFTPFERLGQERGRQPGTGLGLLTARQLAQRLGGDVRLHSEPGRGTTATLRIAGQKES